MHRKKDPEKQSFPSPGLSGQPLPSGEGSHGDWNPLTRIAFRFCFIYFGLYVVASQIFGSLLLIPYFQFRGLGPYWPLREITTWIAAHIFHIETPLTYSGESIGETSFFWVQMFWILAVSIAATGIWSYRDRKRKHYATLHRWFRFFIRLALASQMFEYGMTKIIPNQFPSPPLITLVQPVGNLSLQGLLWASIGASPAYEIFLGCAEMVGGILLLLPRTAMLGALICLADMTQVFVLNMTYDIGLKQISFHLILLCLFLLADDFTRLTNFFFRNRTVESSARANRVPVELQLAFGAYLIAMQTFINWSFWHTGGGGSPRSALYGIWNVEQLSVDGQFQTPALNDYDRQWRRVIFDLPSTVAFQRVDDSIAHYGAFIDPGVMSISLTKGSSRAWKSSFTYQRSRPDELILDGDMDHHSIHMQLQLADFDTFPLLNSTFRWVRPDQK
jgi:hypothetical protein